MQEYHVFLQQYRLYIDLCQLKGAHPESIPGVLLYVIV